MDDKTLIEFLWRYGHFWNRKQPGVLNVKAADLGTLTAKDEVVKQAVQSLQEADANLDVMAMQFHKRRAVADGEAGPATVALVKLDRCSVPDHVPPPGVQVATGDADLDAVIRSMQEAEAVGSGSWPHGCYGTQGVHEVKINYDLSRLTDKHREWWDEIKRRSHQAVADVGVKLIEAPADEANIHVYGRNLPGGTIGLAQFNSGRCGDTVFCQLDPSYTPDIDMVLNLLLHENGHNWNLEHRRGNIMNPSILRTPAVWVKRENGNVTYEDNSYPTLKRFFGGEPLASPEPPPSPPPPPGGPTDPPPVRPIPGADIAVDLSNKRITVPRDWAVIRAG